jgi:hypothetical protein
MDSVRWNSGDSLRIAGKRIAGVGLQPLQGARAANTKKEPGDEAEGPESPGILTHLRRVWVRNWLCC